VPSISPFPLKLESYLRLAKIPYKNYFSSTSSSKGKIPWIEYNGQCVADSNFCVEFLNKEFGVDLDAKLSAKDRAVARTLAVMLDENTYWTMVYFRWIEKNNASKSVDIMFPNVPEWVRTNIARVAKWRVNQYLDGHGIGRHSRDEIYFIALKDLSAVSEILGDKAFLMGNKPTLVDTVAFGLLAVILWHDVNSPQSQLMRTELTNIVEYCERMKALIWPDWDETIAERQELMKPAKP
ncbi:predicted protein, partial [Nematostella vectensis]